MDSIITNLSKAGTEKIIDQVYDHVTTTVRSNSLRVIGGLILACSNANPAYTLKKFVPLCATRINSELNSGAGSRRTLNSTVPIASDVALQWHVSLLVGALSGASIEASPALVSKDHTQGLIHFASSVGRPPRRTAVPASESDGQNLVRGLLVLDWETHGKDHFQHDDRLSL